LVGPAAGAEDFYAWVQFVAGGLEARVVAAQTACPAAKVDGRDAVMTIRAAPDDAFPTLVCALVLPKGASRAEIDGRPLRMPPALPQRIVALGDTGCRLKGFVSQDCNSPTAWPFRQIADAAAAIEPDVVVHVGDYYYRESACVLRAGCAGSPHGDNWEAWKADFFAPAATLLGAAPFVFVRGNHEDCARGWRGWNRMLAPFPYVPGRACVSREAPYAAPLGGPTLLVLDVTAAEDRAADVEQARFFADDLASAAAIEGPVWYAFHKPIYSTIRIAEGKTVGDNKTLALAARGGLPANVQAILSGHLHIFEATSYAESYPAQFVVGNGGDMLDAAVPQRFDGLKIDNVTVEVGRSVGSIYGFATLERDGEEWIVTDRDEKAAALLRCRLKDRKLACD
jgi:hypothetical protein